MNPEYQFPNSELHFPGLVKTQRLDVSTGYV